MLKKLTLLTLILFSFAITTNAQLPISLEINGGIAGSAFEDQESSATGVVVGAAVLIDIIPIIDAGVEFNTTVSPFTFKTTELGPELEVDVTQTYIGAFAKFDILPLVAVTGYLRGGVGMYSGKLEASIGDESESVDFKSSTGFNIGAGVKTMIGIYGEFTYHIVSRELDVEGAPSTGYNNWMLLVGYRFNL
jgi:opacity protein-like surface antigen